MTTYQPAPLDTSRVALSPDLLSLLELLARNTHEVWSAQRLKDGWVPGTERNDMLKHHPCLVPYEDLPESEKDYDRQTAAEVLKAMLALGYEIKKR